MPNLPFSAALCDDDPAARALLADATRQWAQARHIDLALTEFPSAESFLFVWAEKKDFDLLLLDIEMGEINGVELARQVRREDQAIQILFVTGYSDYIAEGYDVSALHYLMKPIQQEKLFSVLDRALKLRQRSQRSLTLELPGETVRLPLYTIRYLDVHQNYVTVHADQDYTLKRSLNTFEQELGEGFFRAGRGLLLQLNYVKKVTRTEVTLTDGTILPLPRGAYEPLNRAIICSN